VTASASGHATAFYCPYCGEEDLRPADAEAGTWECRSCTRRFAVRLLTPSGAS
jgi:ribosomal protein L37AE/L43A